jgi:hypothetical protein
MTTQAAWWPMAGGYRNGWTDLGGLYLPGAYLSDPSGLVYLRGTIKATPAGAGASCYQLPVPLRPGALAEFAAISNGQASYLQIDTNGFITPQGSTANLTTSFDLNGIYFDCGATMGDVVWTAATLQNGWVPYDVTNYFAPAFFKDGQGFVHIRGLMKNGTINSSAFVLPAGYCPTKTSQFPAIDGANAASVVQIDTFGNVTPQIGSNAAYRIDGIIFDTR